MGDFDHSAEQHHGAEVDGHSPRTAFQTQFDFLPKAQQHSQPLNSDHYGAGVFNMGAMAGALPHTSRGSISSHSPYEADGVLSPSAIYQMHHAAQYTAQRVPQLDMSALRGQQQQFLAPDYSPTDRRPSLPQQRGQSFSIAPAIPRVDSYGYHMAMPQFSPVDPRFTPQAFGMNPPMRPDYAAFGRRASEPALIPSFPRGPPRKPKQSGHALWVGNLPPAATVIDLKDHFSRDATKDIESLFLISKSNCAFVNYRTEAACVAAMNRFHDSRFHGVRLVCRLRRGSTMSMRSPSVASTVLTSPITEDCSDSPIVDGHPMIVGSTNSKSDSLTDGEADGVPVKDEKEKPVVDGVGDGVGSGAPKIPEKFFIIKSLTVQDLEASVQNGTWATQSHNETALNEAYHDADNVYLIFSANKSGEYFGYARMASLISGEPVNLGPPANATPEENTAPGTPQSIPTPATETAPKGRIIDDSARGTIFWEAEYSDNEGSESPVKERGEGLSGQNWGKQFKIEWLSTARLPFYRTRGLRNPWNANREVKIARDGTELEPGVGRRLAQIFHRPPPAHGGAQGLGLQQHGVPYQ